MIPSAPNFATTQWTLVWKAAAEESNYGRPALSELIQRYWGPLYAFARQKGLTQSDAEDATQEFLMGILDGDWLLKADPAKGKFRTFLLTAWKRFLIDQFRKENRVRRGGNAIQFSIDAKVGESHWSSLAIAGEDADRAFLVSWATHVLELARTQLQAEYVSSGRERIFRSLIAVSTTPLDSNDYVRLGKELGSSPSAVKVALHRMRQRLGSTIRAVVAQTVDSPDDIEQEIRELISALSTLPHLPTNRTAVP